MQIILYFIIVAGILQSGAIIINQPGNSIQNQVVQATQYACQNGYFFNGQICSQCRSMQNGFCTCSKYGECDQITCTIGFYLIGSQCVQNPDSNCLKGSLSSDGSTVICLQCSGQTTLIGGICIANNNCQQFDAMSGICKQCQTGYFTSVGLGYDDTQTGSSAYYLSMNQCKQCQSHCLSCQNEQFCKTCSSGYFLQESKCVLCVNYVAHCQICETASKCTTCDAEYYLNNNQCSSCAQSINNCSSCSLDQSNQLMCSKCKVGSYLNNNQCPLCSTQISYCKQCSNSTTCQGCYSGFYLSSNMCKMCSASISNCLFCSDSNTCNTCQDGYYLQSNVCIKCSISLSNCGTCSNSQNCTGCLPSYYLDSNKICQTCSGAITNCIICTNSTKCDKCKTGYYWDGTNCQPCTDTNCTECSNNSSCSTCLIGFSTDSTKCTACSSGSCMTCTGQNYNNKGNCLNCSAVMNGCKYCGYNGDTLQCTECLAGQAQAPPNVQPCQSDLGAPPCPGTQFLYGNTCKNCDQAITNCSECSYSNQQLTCTKCNSGYNLGGSCEPCQSSSGSGSGSGSGSSSPDCKKCAQGTYFDSGSTSCKTCIQNCSVCSDASTCTNCITGYFWNNSSCVLCAKTIFNCGECSNSTTCTSCLPGFILDGNNCTPCSYFISNCFVCKTNSICLQCAPGNYLNAQSTCSPCDDSNCINCSQSSSQCTACASGTYLNGTQCQSCSTISKCIACSTSSKCTACQSGTFLKNDQCQPCDDQNCTQCNPSSICTVCIAGYYANNNGCTQCPNGCTSCLSNSQCNQCATGFYLDGNTCTNCTTSLTKCLACINTSTCTNCDAGNFLDGNSCTKCPNTLSSCSACKSNTNCIACNQGSYLNGSQCTSCNDNNCLTCTDASTCTSCAPNYVVLNNGCTKCTGYSDKCTTCSNGYCSGCISNYLIQSDGTCLKCPDNCSQGCAKNTQANTNPTICQICQDQYYLTSSGLCTKCQNNFLRCNYDSGTQQVYPTQCVDGYFLVNKLCIKAQDENTCYKLYQPNDGTQINSQLCSDCWPSYIQSNQICYKCSNCADNSCSLDQNNKPICSQCANYYYSDSNSTCQQCVVNCIQCNALGIENCQQCDIGYYKSSSACIACTTDNSNKPTCLNCSNETTCTTCQNGYFGSNGQCLACQYGCSQCVSPGNTCIGCIAGFYLQNGGCVQDLGNCLEKQQNQNNGCQICAYGFYPIKGWLSQSSQSQVVDTICLQCVQPQAAFVCRANPSANQVASASYGSIPSLKNQNYFKTAAPLGPTRLTTPQCKLGSFWTQQSCMPCPTINNGICSACNNFTSCTQIQCNAQYQLITIKNVQQCALIPTGCTEIQYSDKMISLACTKCSTGYTLIGNICISINGCLTINQNNGACTSCTNGYYFNWNFQLQNPTTSLSINTYYYQYFKPFCSQCNAGCAICPSQYTCTQCLPGYFWYQSTLTTNPYSFKTYTNAQTNASGQCVACPKNCKTCTSATVCTACNTNFTVDPNQTNGDCICQSPYTYNQSNQSCIQQPSGNSICSIAGCIQCNSDNTQCQACSPQYALTSPTSCTQCLNCNQCSLLAGTSNPTCQECADGYYKVQAYDGAPITCQLCSQSLNNSLRCQGDLENQTQLTIIQCVDNFFLLGNVCYQVENTNCFTIANSNSQTCQQCLPGYTLYGNNCDQCNTQILNCLTCISNQDQSGLNCQSCINGYVLNTNTNSCQQCPSGCQTCTVTGTAAPYTLSCNTCADGNYIDGNGNCQGCPFDCKSCDSKYNCNTCNDGFFLIQSSITFNSKSYIFKPCYPCQNNCATCTGPTGNVCQTCKTGFVLQSGGCIDLTLKIQNDQNPYSLANCYSSDSTGCTVCLAGFFLDSQRVCQECVSPYNNFVCGFNAVAPTTPTNNTSGQTNTNNTSGNTNTNTTANSIEIGQNPTQPSSSSQILVAILIFMIQ